MKTILTLILCFFLSPLALAQDDVTAGALERAKASFDSASTEFKESVLKWFKMQEDRARAKGDRKALITSETLRNEFSKSGKMPGTAPKSLRRKQELINSRMEAAYLLAVRDFTRMGNDQLATQTEKQLEDFRKTLINTPDRQLWKHGGGSFAILGEEVWEEKLSDGRSFRYQEVDRNEEYIEIDALTGDTKIRIRIYDDRTELGHKPSLVFKKHLDGNWAEKK